MRVLLASTSPARHMLLRNAGIDPETMAPDVDEEAVIADTEQRLGRVLPASEHVLLLAEAKATDVAHRLSVSDPGFGGVVIGGDSMFELGSDILGKPHTAEVATERLRRMRGRTGVLHSGHSVIRVAPGQEFRRAQASTAATVTFVADIDDDEIAAYVGSGEPLAVAGAFTLDSLGGPFIERVEGDPSTVIGMSLSTLRHLTRGLGVPWHTLWRPGTSTTL